MRTRSRKIVIATLCAMLVSSSFRAAEGSDTATSASSSSTPSSAGPSQAEAKKTLKANDSPSVPPSKLSDHARAEARRRHIRPVDRLRIAVPPPEPREETKTTAPGSNYVWKPGHWAPAEGKWEWIAGEWAVPPTSISVWIEGKYDEKEKRWAPGYWQPDSIQPAESDTPANNSIPIQRL